MGIVSGSAGGGLPGNWASAGPNEVLSTGAAILVATDGVNNIGLELDGSGNGDISGNGGFVLATGFVLFEVTPAAPASADLDASSFALWLDATPGATKLMVKAKDSGGTVRTAAINLA